MTEMFFWRLWLDSAKRPWADRWGYAEPSTARDHHSRAKGFHWVQRGTVEASVSDLFADNGTRTVSVAEGGEWEGKQTAAAAEETARSGSEADAPDDPPEGRPSGVPLSDPPSGPDIGWVGP